MLANFAVDSKTSVRTLIVALHCSLRAHYQLQAPLLSGSVSVVACDCPRVCPVRCPLRTVDRRVDSRRQPQTRSLTTRALAAGKPIHEHIGLRQRHLSIRAEMAGKINQYWSDSKAENDTSFTIHCMWRSIMLYLFLNDTDQVYSTPIRLYTVCAKMDNTPFNVVANILQNTRYAYCLNDFKQFAINYSQSECTHRKTFLH